MYKQTIKKFEIKIKIFQIFYLFLILYLFYNTNLLNIYNKQITKKGAIIFVNNINILFYNTSNKTNCKTSKK